MKHVGLPSLLGLVMVTMVALGGCRTTVAFDVVIPAEVNMSSYRTVGVFDFTEYELSRFTSGGYIEFDFFFNGYYRPIEDRLLSSEVARYMTQEMVRTLDRTGYFTIIPPGQLRSYLMNQAAFQFDAERLHRAFGLEAMIIGTIEDMDTREFVQERVESTVNTDTGERERILRSYFIQETYLQISYSVVSAEDGRILATKRLDGRKRQETPIPRTSEMPTGWSERDFRAPSVLPLYRRIIEDFTPEIRDQLAPRTVREVRRLQKDTSGDFRAERADELVKEGIYREAIRLFQGIWYEQGDFSAGYNAAVLYEALGELDQAVSLMRDVASVTGERLAFQELNRLIDAREQRLRAQKQLQEFD